MATWNVVSTQTEYTVTADFLVDINTYSITLEDESSVTTVDEQTLPVDGTVAIKRCGDATENVNPGDKLCLEIYESGYTSIGVESIHNLDLTQGVIKLEAIKDGEEALGDLLEVECADEICTVNER